MPSNVQFNKISIINNVMKTAALLAVEEVRRLNQQQVAKDSKFIGNVYARHDGSVVALVFSNEQQTYTFRFDHDDFDPDSLPATKKVLMEYHHNDHMTTPSRIVNMFGGVKGYLDMLYELSDGNTEKSYITNDIIG